MIPTGEIPRSLKVCVSKYLVDKLSPGTRVTLTGIYTVCENNYVSNKVGTGQMKVPYMNTLGLAIEKLGTRKYEARFT
jgi:DNA replication licensing factor MCM5